MHCTNPLRGGSYLHQSNETRQEVAKLLVLDFLKLALSFSKEAVMERVKWIQEDYRRYGHRVIDYKVVESHNIEHGRYETHADAAQDLVDAIEFVISSTVNIRTNNIGDATGNSKGAIPITLQDLFEDIRGSCTQLQKLVARFQAFNQRRYELYLSTLNIHESQSVKRLTALATGFLPLSLGASLLSMQTRFADLSYLIYDFLGVGLLLFCSMGVVLVLLKLFLTTKDWRPFGAKSLNIESLEVTPEQARKLKAKIFLQDKLVPWIGRAILIGSSVFVLATFLVGMFRKVSLGLIILGYGAAAILGFLIAVVVLVFVFFVFIFLLNRQIAKLNSRHQQSN